MAEKKLTYEELLEENTRLKRTLDLVENTKISDDNSKTSFFDSKLFEIFNGLEIGIICAEPDSGNFKYANNEMAFLTGYTVQELQELNVSKFHPQNSLEKIKSIFEKLVNREISKALEIPVIKKDGTIIYFDVTATIQIVNSSPLLVGLFTNVSDLVENNKLLYKTKEMFKQLVETSSDGILICENDQILFANHLVSDILEISYNQLLNSRVELFFNEIGFIKLQELKSLRDSGNLDSFKFECKDRKSNKSLEITTGKFNYLGRNTELLFLRDISDVATIYHKIKDSEEKSLAMLKAMPDLVFRLSIDGKFLDVHSNSLSDLFIPPEHFIGKNIKDVLPPEIAELSLINFKSAWENRKVLSYEYSLEMYGKLEFFEARVSPISNTNEVVSIIRNVTKREILQKAIQEKENLFKTIAYHSKDVIWIYNLTKNKFEFNSPSVFNLRGFTPDEAALQKMEDVFTPETLKLVNDELPLRLQSFLNGSGNATIQVDEFQEYHKDGHLIYTEVNTSFFINTDSSICVLGITRDITKRKKSEKQELLHKNIIDLIVSGRPLNETLQNITEAIEFEFPDSLASVMKYNQDSETLDYICGGKFSKEYIDGINGLKVGKGLGACGHAVYTKGMVVSEELLNDEYWEQFRELVIAENLNACFSIPILSSNGSVLGTFAVYHRIPFKPSKDNISFIEGFVSIASIAMQRHIGESSLRESEDKFSKAFNSSPDSLTISTLDNGTFIEINEVFCEEFIFNKEDIIGKTSLEINIWANKIDRTLFRKELEKFGKIKDFEAILVNKLGVKMYFLLSAQVFTIADGTRCILTNVRNITQAKKEQQEKERLIQREKESSGRIIDILETISDGFISISADWFITYLNLKAGEFSNKSPKLVSGKSIWEEFNLNIDNPFRKACYEAAELKKVNLVTEYIFEFKRWLEFKIYPAQEGLNVFFRDITEQKQAEIQLKESELRFRTLFESTPDGIIYYDENGKEELFNLSALQILKIEDGPRSERLDNNVPFIIVDQNGKEIKYEESATFTVLKTGIPLYNQIFGLTRKSNNEVLWVSSNVIPFKDEKGRIKVFTSFADITQQKLAEEALIKSQAELKRTNQIAKLGNFKMDLQTLIFEGSTEAYEIVGFTCCDKIPITKVLEKVHRRDLHLFKEFWLKSLGGENFNFEHRVVVDGKIRWLSIWAESNYSKENKSGEVIGMLMDITERKNAELKAENEKERLITLIQTIPDLVWVKDADGKFILCNTKFSKLYNKEPAEIIGLTDYDLVDKKLADEYSSIDKLALESNEPIKSFGEMKLYDGRNNLIVETFKTKLFDAEGNLVGILGVGRDLTEITGATKALLESERKLKEAQHFAKMGNWELNFKTNTLIWSEEIFKIFEIDKSIFKATYEAFINAIHPDDRELVDTLYTNSLKTKKAYEVTHRLLMPDGRIKYVQEKGTSYFDENGEPIRSIGTVQDISEIHQVQQALKDREQILSSILDTVGNGIFLINVDGDDEFEFLTVNKMMSKIIGLPEKQIVGKRFDEIVDIKEFTEVSNKKFREAIQFKKAVSWEISGTRKGESFTGDVNVVPVFDSANNCIYIVGAIHDITFRKKVEQELNLLNQMLEERVMERTEQLEAANKDLESFAYSVSHDLRAPLRHIDGFTKLLRSSFPEQLPDESIKYFKKINDAGSKMSDMIDSLLKFSRLGRQALQLTRFSLNKVVEQIIKDAEPDFRERVIEFKIDDLPSIIGDKHLIEMAFNNLVLNAIKFTQHKESAIIQIGNFEAGEEYFGIFIKDNGAGFDMAYVDKLFGVFQRLHSQGQFSGTGIGLANVQQIIKKHNGSIWAEGEENIGATFYIKLKKNL